MVIAATTFAIGSDSFPSRSRRRSAAGPAPHPLQLAAEPLARPALAADRLDAGRDLADDRRWAVVDVGLGGNRRADTSFDRPHDLDDPLALGNERMDDVAGTDLRRRLRRVAVHADVSALAQLGRHRPRLDEA